MRWPLPRSSSAAAARTRSFAASTHASFTSRPRHKSISSSSRSSATRRSGTSSQISVPCWSPTSHRERQPSSLLFSALGQAHAVASRAAALGFGERAATYRPSQSTLPRKASGKLSKRCCRASRSKRGSACTTNKNSRLMNLVCSPITLQPLLAISSRYIVTAS